jgi:hypothetical protein
MTRAAREDFTRIDELPVEFFRFYRWAAEGTVEQATEILTFPLRLAGQAWTRMLV